MTIVPVLQGCGGGEGAAGAGGGGGANGSTAGRSEGGTAGQNEGARAGNASAGEVQQAGQGGAAIGLPVACQPPAAGLPGELDPSFPQGAKGLGSIAPDSVEIDRKGRLLVVGDTVAGTFALARFTADGAPDKSFSGDGLFNQDLRPDTPSSARFAVDDEQGRIWVGGSAAEPAPAPNSAVVFRLLEDGKLDTTFNAAGEVPGALYFRPRDTDAALMTARATVDDLIVAEGGAWLHGDPLSSIERVKDDGTLDLEFHHVNHGRGPIVWAYDALFVGGDPMHAYHADGTPRLDFGRAGELKLL
ncbi:MAG TPA: hypothetical protein VNG33_14360, partial [Polyangiaceae bacterium]|nr:hypothetical protein [Polyangiaceae bacterium]